MRFASHVSRSFAGDTSPLQWPSFISGVVEHGAGFTVYYGVDHSHTDGLSLMLGVEELRALYIAESAGIDAQLPSPGSYVEYSVEERTSAGNLDLAAAPVQQWISILAANAGQLPTFPLDLGVARGEQTRSTRTHIDVLDSDESAAFASAVQVQWRRLLHGDLRSPRPHRDRNCGSSELLRAQRSRHSLRSEIPLFPRLVHQSRPGLVHAERCHEL